MTLKSINDGHVAITYEDRGGTLRAIDHVPRDDRPPYIAIGDVTRMSADVCKLAGFNGRLTRRHMRLIVRLLGEQGYRVAYMDRLDGHRIPGAEQIEAGDWAGWWRLDLQKVA